MLLREGVKSVLELGGHEVVAAVEDEPSLIAAVREHEPDLSIVDVRMPPGFSDEGLRAAVKMRTENPRRRFLVLSQYVSHTSAAELLSIGDGGIGYLLKDRVGPVRAFLAAVDDVGTGGSVIDPDVVRQLMSRHHNRNTLATLSPRESEVLALMAEGATNAAIAARLVVSEAAVSKHVNGIFMKLGFTRRDTDHRRVLAVLRYLGR